MYRSVKAAAGLRRRTRRRSVEVEEVVDLAIRHSLGPPPSLFFSFFFC